MMSGKMDLSIGYASCLTAVICARLNVELGVSAPLVILIAIVLNMLLIVINVLLSQYLKIDHIFVSFGTMTAYQGLAYIASNSKTISGLSDGIKRIGQERIFTILGGNMTYGILIMVIVIVVCSFILNKTYFGRNIFAIGGNAEAAKYAGIDVKRMEIMIGMICGALSGLGTMVLIGRIGSATAAINSEMTFTVITGLLVGGVSIRGGEGKIGGCVAGVLIVGILQNGMMMMGLDTYYQYVFKGLIMIVTIAIDTMQLNARDKKERKVKTEKRLQGK